VRSKEKKERNGDKRLRVSLRATVGSVATSSCFLHKRNDMETRRLGDEARRKGLYTESILRFFLFIARIIRLLSLFRAKRRNMLRSSR